MTRFRLMLFALSCTVIFMVIVLAIITFSKSDPVVVAAPVLAANPEKFSGQEIEIHRALVSLPQPALLLQRSRSGMSDAAFIGGRKG